MTTVATQLGLGMFWLTLLALMSSYVAMPSMAAARYMGCMFFAFSSLITAHAQCLQVLPGGLLEGHHDSEGRVGYTLPDACTAQCACRDIRAYVTSDFTEVMRIKLMEHTAYCGNRQRKRPW